MNCLMAENQRRAILEAIPPHGRMLEWGPGGTTQWLLAHLSADQSIVSVEHSPIWDGPVQGACGGHRNWRMIYEPVNAGENATRAEEIPADLERYICPPVDLASFDVFLIDGIARGACMANVLLHGRAGAVVFIHDAGRTWYRWAIQMGKHRLKDETTIEPEPGGYPALMWKATLA